MYLFLLKYPFKGTESQYSSYQFFNSHLNTMENDVTKLIANLFSLIGTLFIVDTNTSNFLCRCLSDSFQIIQNYYARAKRTVSGRSLPLFSNF
jgi:hypothetical protein